MGKILAALLLAATAVVGIVGVIVMSSVVGAFFLSWAWNGAMVPVFGLMVITKWQAFQLTMVAGFLLKSSTTVNKSN